MSNLGITLKTGENILELLTFENEKNFDEFPDPEKSYEEVVNMSLNEEHRTPKTFLNIEGHDTEIQSLLFTKGMKIAGYIITGLVGVLTILNIISYFNVNKLVSEAYDLEKIDLSREIDKLNARIRQLEEKP